MGVRNVEDKSPTTRGPCGATHAAEADVTGNEIVENTVITHDTCRGTRVDEELCRTAGKADMCREKTVETARRVITQPRENTQDTDVASPWHRGGCGGGSCSEREGRHGSTIAVNSGIAQAKSGRWWFILIVITAFLLMSRRARRFEQDHHVFEADGALVRDGHTGTALADTCVTTNPQSHTGSVRASRAPRRTQHARQTRSEVIVLDARCRPRRQFTDGGVGGEGSAGRIARALIVETIKIEFQDVIRRRRELALREADGHSCTLMAKTRAHATLHV